MSRWVWWVGLWWVGAGGRGLFQFPQPRYHLSLPEDARGKVWAREEAGQPKLGLPSPGPGNISYAIVKGDPDGWFRLTPALVGDFVFLRLSTEPTNLALALNRELQDTFTLLVTATYRQAQGPNLQTSVELVVGVRDQNDLVPRFGTAHYTVKVPSSAAALSEVVRVKAEDADEGLAGEVSYSLQPPSDLFAVHPLSGAVVLLRPLGPSPASHSLVVAATDRLYALRPDSAIAQRPTITAKVQLDVLPSNLHDPTIALSSEDLATSRHIDRVANLTTVTLDDEDFHPISDVSLHFLQPQCDGVFQLTPLPGATEQFLLQTIPVYTLPESLSFCQLRIEAVDSGTPSRNSSKEFRVALTEQRPGALEAVEPRQSVTLNASLPFPSPVALLQVRGGVRLRPELRFELLSDPAEQLAFRVDARSGVVWTSGPLSAGEEVLEVRAKDGAETVQWELRVAVEPWNEATPVFREQASSYDVAASLGPGRTAFTVKASDSDEGPNGRVYYRLLSARPLPFEVDAESGAVRVRRPLPPGQTFRLRIRASDFGSPVRREAEAVWLVRTANASSPRPARLRRSPDPAPSANDAAPLFPDDAYQGDIQEDAPIGHIILTATAKDTDKGFAGFVQYYLAQEGNEDGIFAVDTYSGQVKVFRPPSDVAQLSDEYKLSLVASDLGDPSKSTSVPLKILMKRKEKPIQFSQRVFRASVAEDAAVGTEVVGLSARLSRPELRFSLLSLGPHFSVDPESGLVRVAERLDREVQASHSVLVGLGRAGEAVASEARLEVEVVDVNDEPPRCGERRRAEVAEDFPPGALVTCLGATDPDEGANGRLRYRLLSDDAPFRLHASSGCLFVAAGLDYETRALYNLSLEVSDSGLPAFSALCSLLVQVKDVDENLLPPAFPDAALEASVYEGEAVGTEVAQLTAVDPEDPDTQPLYSILGPHMPALFSIDPFGVVRTRAVLDREGLGGRSGLWVEVEARDRAAAPRASRLQLFVAVLDRNDQRPLVAQPLYRASVSENSPPRTLVTTLAATDPDLHQTLRYRIARGDPQSFFHIHPTTGEVRTAGRRLDRETDGEQELEIRVSDGGSPELSATAVLRVSLLDENDNDPAFPRLIYNFLLPPPSGLAPGAVLARVSASDPDQGSNARLSYSLSESGDLFRVDAQSGAISAKKDLVAGSEYGLGLRATDGGGRSAETRVLLSVREERERSEAQVEANAAPALLAEEELRVAADEAPGAQVGLLAAEDPDGDPLWWDLLEGDVDSAFALRGDTGELTLARPLADLNASSYQLSYRVGDGLSSVNGEVTVLIVRDDVSAVGWAQSRFSAQVEEAAPVGTVVFDASEFLNESDVSLPSPSALTFFVQDTQRPSSAAKFKMEPRSGRLVLVEKLDHEVDTLHVLTLGLRHKSSRDFARLVVSVADANDHSPTFVRSRLEVRVSEDAAAGRLVSQLQAFDPDSGANGLVRYSVLSGNDGGHWTLDEESGEVRVGSEGLDRGEWVLVVKAQDSGQPPRSETATVRLLVGEGLRSPPRFQREVFALEAEESTPLGSSLLQLFAESPGGGVFYSLGKPAPNEVAIHPVSGVLTLVAPLDFHTKPHLNFTVEARSSEKLSTEALVQLTVVDSNTRAPVFSEAVYEGLVRENAGEGTLVRLVGSAEPLVLRATDGDSGSNGLVSFALRADWASEYFAVDFGTGAIRTKAPLDYEQQHTVEFQVVAKDLGSPALVSPVPATVRITVEDVNDVPPTFPMELYSATLFLPAGSNTRLLTLEAEDLDSAKLTYSLQVVSPSDDVKHRFRVNATTGELVLVEPSGLSVGDVFELEVRASDGAHSAQTTARVKVAERAKTNLRFEKELYSVAVKENAEEEEDLVWLHLLDTAVGEAVSFSLLNPSAHFALDGRTGALRTTGLGLDRETAGNVTLVVEGRDERWPPRVAQTSVRVEVLDENDCAPKFLGLPLRAVVSTAASAGDVVAELRAVDWDDGRNGQLKYFVEESELVEVEAVSGTVRLRKALDPSVRREERRLGVWAEDGGEEALRTEAVLTLSLVNEAMPVFAKAAYSVRVSEGLEPGAAVLAIAAHSAINSTIAFAITQGDTRSNFHLHHTKGVLRLVRGLDREAGAWVNLTVRATDVSRADIFSEVGVAVSVSDLNDHAPAFAEAAWEGRVSEAAAVGTPVLRLTASDADQGANANLSFALDGDPDRLFRLHPHTGQLSLAKPLDFESAKEHRLTATVTDAGFPEPLSSSAPLTVRVGDVNDNAPVFQHLAFEASVLDSAAEGDFVTLLTASDADSRPRLHFALLQGDLSPPLLKVEAETGLVELARRVPSDLALPADLPLNVSVTDGVFTAHALLRLRVLAGPGSSTPPALAKSLYQASVAENGPAGSRVVSFKALGGTAPLRFRLAQEAGSELFELDAESGLVRLAKSLDFEEAREHRLAVFVEDAEGRRGFGQLLVNVLDKNDHKPAFVAGAYAAAVHANATPSTNVLHFIALDGDTEDSVEYSIVKDPASPSPDSIFSLFKLHRRRGMLSVKKGLASLAGQTFSFFVRATDRGNPPLQSQVPVKVRVVSPETEVPRFALAKKTFRVSEDTAIGAWIGDGGPEMRRPLPGTRFSIAAPPEGAQGLPFSVQEDTGRLKLSLFLDFEIRPVHSFMLVARSDSGTQSMSRVSVKVTDANDNSPRFLSAETEMSVSEDLAVGSSVTVVSALDPDRGSSGHVRYSLEGASADFFTLKEDSGWLTLRRPLDREASELLNLTVVAKDGGSPPLSSQTQLILRVSDANDNPPVFAGGKQLRMSVEENSAAGTQLGTVEVTDADLNSHIRLFIVEGNEEGLFGIRDSGELYVAKPPDFEAAPMHNLRLLASDGRHWARARLDVEVRDANDHRPVCSPTRASLTVAEDAAVDSELLLVAADDADSAQHGLASFRLQGHPEKVFRVSEGGNLQLAALLDREKRDSYDLVVRALDTGKRFCDCIVHIRVLDVNDNPPRLDEGGPLTASVPENLPDGAHLVSRVPASDPDLGDAARLRFSLSDLNDQDIKDKFWIDESSGALSVRQPLDREARDHYNISVDIADFGSPSLGTVAVVFVSVEDANDNPPEMVAKELEASLSELSELGTLVATVEAVGKDLNDQITYSLAGPQHAEEFFSVDAESGEVRLTKALDYEERTSFVLVVEASEEGTTLKDSATLTVTVEDANDNPPRLGMELYTARVDESAELGHEVLQLSAQDPDSGPNARLSFRLDGPKDLPFALDDGGRLLVSRALDWERTKSYQFIVEVSDAGQPPLSHSASVEVQVLDVNDIAPSVQGCGNLTGKVSEGQPAGTPILSLEVEDGDGHGNGAPFRLSVVGEGSQDFGVTGEGELVTTVPLTYAVRKLYLLSLRAEDAGEPAQSTECPLTVEVTEESKYPPELAPTQALVQSYLGEFPGGVVAVAAGTDKDPQDLLRYRLIPSEDSHKLQDFITLDSSSGEIVAAAGLPSGEYRLNVSVTDGRFSTSAPVHIKVIPITEVELNFAISIRLAGVSPEGFVATHLRNFEKAIARAMSVRPRNVRVLSIQEGSREVPPKEARRRFRRRLDRWEGLGSGDEASLDVLFAVRKGGRSGGFFRPNALRRRLESKGREIGAESGGVEVVGLMTETCRRDSCQRGQCMDRLSLRDGEVERTGLGARWFVGPRHEREAECTCQEGYGGPRCDVAVNGCSREPCGKWELCVPVDSPQGFTCLCPPGKTGPICADPLPCREGEDCASGPVLRVAGDGYVSFTLSTQFQRRLELALQLRTKARDGVLLHSQGRQDFHALEIRDGRLQYRWDCGSGEAIVRLGQDDVADGHWHHVRVTRRGKTAKLVLDHKHSAETTADGPNDILNLRDNRLVVGALVGPHPSLKGHKLASRGFVGCLRGVEVDGFQLPISASSSRLHNLELGCPESFIEGVCSSGPCEHFGRCEADPLNDGFLCHCEQRYTGARCQIDLDACADEPCLHGARCHNRFDDFVCRCPRGFHGKVCELSGSAKTPVSCQDLDCGTHGDCLPGPPVSCLCSDGFTGRFCETEPPRGPEVEGSDGWLGVSPTEAAALAVVLLFLVLLACVIVCCCRRRSRRQRRKGRYAAAANNEPAYDLQPHYTNNQLSAHGLSGTQSTAPPPLPPRSRIQPNSKLSNLHSAHQTGLPTAQVQPISVRQAEREVEGQTPRRRRHSPSNLRSARHYGSAAEELEALAREPQLSDLLHQLAKPSHTAHRGNLERDSSEGSSGHVAQRRRQATRDSDDDWKANLHLLSADSIQRLKEEADRADRPPPRPPHSDASIALLPDEPGGYHWDYSDWNSTLGCGEGEEGDYARETEDEGASLPPGVSALDDEDSDAPIGDDDELLPASVPALPPSDFTQRLLAMGRPQPPACLPPPPLAPPPPTSAPPVEEDMYVTMRPLKDPDSAPPSPGSPERNGNSRSQPTKYGFPRPARQPLALHTYDLPPYADRRPSPTPSDVSEHL